MKNIFRLAISVFLAFAIFSPLFAVESNTQGQVEFNIRLYDRRIYYVESSPIYVQVTITNNSPSPYRFKLADERAFSIDFDIRTMTNLQLPEASSLIRKRTQYSQIFFREIAIESGESFSFVEDLRDYATFNQSGSFRISAKIYPELYRSTSVPAIESNYLTLSLRPPLLPGNDGIPLEMDIATGAVLVRQKLPPDEVVSYMLRARQASQWERFFLYLDLESLLTRDPVQKRRWLAENEEGRNLMTAQYRQRLQSPTTDDGISVSPTTFEIQRTVYDNLEGTVVVLQKFRMINYTELRRYTYFLEKRNDFWIVVHYSLEGLGTEAND